MAKEREKPIWNWAIITVIILVVIAAILAFVRGATVNWTGVISALVVFCILGAIVFYLKVETPKQILGLTIVLLGVALFVSPWICAGVASLINADMLAVFTGTVLTLSLFVILAGLVVWFTK